MQEIRTDVLIAGAGPSGLMLACLLARQGIDFIIIDKATEKVMNSGALVIHAASLEILRSLGLLNEALAESTVVRKATLKISGRKEYAFDISGLDKSGPSSPAMVLLEQFKLENILRQHLAASGRKILTGHSLNSLTSASPYCLSAITDNTGSGFTVTSKYVVGADGKDSAVRELIKFTFRKHRHLNPIFVMDYEGDAVKEPGEISFLFNKQGSFGIFPLKSNYIRLDGALPGLFKEDGRIVFEDIKDYLPSGAGISRVRWFSVFYSNYLLCDTFRSGNIFLIGDAAHTHNPVGGQGLNSGFQDALNLGWKLSYAVKGLMHADFLDTYTSERRPAVKKIMDKSDFVFRHITNFSKINLELRMALSSLLSSLAKILFNSAHIRFKLFKGISQLWIRYSSPLVAKSTPFRNSKTGTLFRYQAALPDIPGFYTNYKLLILSENNTAPNHPDLKPFPLDIISLADLPDSRKLFKSIGLSNVSSILLRPDNFIAMVSHKPDTASIIKYFKDMGK